MSDISSIVDLVHDHQVWATIRITQKGCEINLDSKGYQL